MRRVLLIAGFVIAFGAGWAASLLFLTVTSPRVNSEWYQLSTAPGETGIRFSREALFKSDIALPEVKVISGTAKYASDASGASSTVRLGYKIAVDVAALDLSKVPEKYKKEKPVDIGGGNKFTVLPIDQVTYEVRFDFTLKDKDGFPLLELQSEPQSIASGKTNTFQSLAPATVPVGIASRTSAILIAMTVTKCLTCDTE